MFTLLAAIYLFLLAVILASLEIEIEGQHGWAAKLPTWRPVVKSWYANLYSKVMHQKELTGYHLHMFALVFLFFHLPFFIGLRWGVFQELEIISSYFLFVVFWDFLWFILNPHIDFKNFKESAKIVHKEWLGPLPADYYWGLFLSFVFYLPLVRINLLNLVGWFQTFTIFLILTILVNYIEPWIRRQKR